MFSLQSFSKVSQLFPKTSPDWFPPQETILNTGIYIFPHTPNKMTCSVVQFSQEINQTCQNISFFLHREGSVGVGVGEEKLRERARPGKQ